MHNINSQAWFRDVVAGEFGDKVCQWGHFDNFRFVGGCVRNSLLNLPISDIDVASKLPPEEGMKLFADQGYTVRPTGLQHGTFTLMVCKEPIEITTLRKDVETDGRHAVVEFVDDWATDAARRDFTINALYADMTGKVYAPVGGLDDIETGTIRFVGDPEKRIEEDALRILRFFRFSAAYSKTWLNAEGYAACRKLKGNLKGISAERITTELFKLLATDKHRFVLRDMDLAGILPMIIPNYRGLETLHGLYYSGFKAGIPTFDPLLRFRAMLPNDDHSLLDASKQRKLSLVQRARLRACVIAGPRYGTIDKELRAHVYRVGKEAYRDQFHLYWAMNTDKTAPTSILDYAMNWKIPTFPVAGDDLLAKGVKEGARLGRALKVLEERWIESDFTQTKDDLLGPIYEIEVSGVF